MKKITSLLLTALLLATMLCVFAVPASAATNYVGKWVCLKMDCTGRLPSIADFQERYFFVFEKVPGPSQMTEHQVAIYILDTRDNTVHMETDTLSSDMFIGIDANIPQAVLSKAAQDYPNLASTGSTLSEGSLTIICTVAAAVVFGLGGFFIGKAAGKKKKPALASGENKDEE